VVIATHPLQSPYLTGPDLYITTDYFEIRVTVSVITTTFTSLHYVSNGLRIYTLAKDGSYSGMDNSQLWVLASEG